VLASSNCDSAQKPSCESYVKLHCPGSCGAVCCSWRPCDACGQRVRDAWRDADGTRTSGRHKASAPAARWHARFQQSSPLSGRAAPSSRSGAVSSRGDPAMNAAPPRRCSLPLPLRAQRAATAFQTSWAVTRSVADHALARRTPDTHKSR